jgi:hypothetical protein
MTTDSVMYLITHLIAIFIEDSNRLYYLIRIQAIIKGIAVRHAPDITNNISASFIAPPIALVEPL